MKKDENAHKKMWEGRFSEASSKLLEEFNASINFYKNLFKYKLINTTKYN